MQKIDPKYLTPDSVQKAVAWCVTNGLTVARGQGGYDHCPVMLSGTPFPKDQLELGKSLSEAFNTIVDKCARDKEFIKKSLSKTAEADPFTGKLLDIYEEVYGKDRDTQKYMMGIHRSDYMLDATDKDAQHIKQIEINTIASAFGGLSPLTNKFHTYMSGNVGVSEAEQPVSWSDKAIPEVMAKAVEVGCPGSVALFIVQEGERNTSDQRILEQNLWSMHKVRTIRKSLQQVATEGKIDSEGYLAISGERCGMVYYRAGYGPGDYPTDACWTARMMIEESRAVKCPSVPYQLIGTKKVQQLLCDSEILKKYCPAEKLESVLSVFAQMSGLEDAPKQNAVIAAAIENPADWLLKPQREGGGSLIFDEAMVQVLKNLTLPQRAEFILMKKIRPPAFPSAVLRSEQLHEDTFISELGIYGTYLGNGESLHNECGGFLLRSKPEHQPDGGVAAGVAALDSPVPY
eukprot:TRINITY_DN4931_c0_g1_i1.p1 TRINITY_DN4931_c0_g1~~TRINITY_DN4931_c0_g1_i1.p1  ORF type:complete len:460 (+),score=111.44 TRINITY_DN4931_c0_g1_i1:106-1485(+)